MTDGQNVTGTKPGMPGRYAASHLPQTWYLSPVTRAFAPGDYRNLSGIGWAADTPVPIAVRPVPDEYGNGLPLYGAAS